ncbi:MAG: hypothetical protein JO139_18510, partial [Alphaproteobacteria bacterium]|nr:hypothetical protein [Alphaproteobacteria bacterium]
DGGKFGPRERVEGYHPFPALSAIRIPARSPEPSTTLLRKADAVFLKKIRNTVFTGQSDGPLPCCLAMQTAPARTVYGSPTPGCQISA